MSRTISLSSLNVMTASGIVFLGWKLIACGTNSPAGSLYGFLALLLVVLIIVGAAAMPYDPYGTFHLSMNAVPGQHKAAKPATEWLNMGYWKHTNVFPEACQALALKLAKAAGCKPGGIILDVGYGSGESLVFHLTNPAVPRPSKLVGITSLRSHYERSLERIENLNLQGDSSLPEVQLYHGDAIYRSSSSGHHPLDPSNTNTCFSNVLALDCAYHFDTRMEFLKQAFARLEPEGRVALADLCFDSSVTPSWIRTAIGFLGLIRRDNAVTFEKYVRDMQGIGYVDVSLEDISDDVFPGFIKFLSGHGVGWKLFATVLRQANKSGLRFVLVTGTKPKL